MALDFGRQTTESLSVSVLSIFYCKLHHVLANSPSLIVRLLLVILAFVGFADILPLLEENSQSHLLIITPEDFTYCRVILKAAQLKLDSH